MNQLEECSICGCEVDDQTLHGHFTDLPVAFCIWCQSHLELYCKSYE